MYSEPRDPAHPTVVFVADDYCAMPLAAAIASVEANLKNGRQCDVFVLDGGLSQKSKEKILRLRIPGRLKIEWLQPLPEHVALTKRFPSGAVGRITYYRLFIPEMLPDCPRLIYLDCDMIVEGDISHLWDEDIEDYFILAVQDMMIPFVSSPLGLPNWRELGRKENDRYFNSGLIVFNGARWRRERITARITEYLLNHGKYLRFCDQDALNAVLGNDWGALDLRWNVLPILRSHLCRPLMGRKDHERMLADAWGIHYCSPNKPWRRRCLHPRKDRFFFYLDRTAWAGWRPRWWMVNVNAVRSQFKRLVSRKNRA